MSTSSAAVNCTRNFLQNNVLTSELLGYYINIRSLCDPVKYNYIYEILSSKKPAFFGITETWLPDTPGVVASLAIPNNYLFFHHNPRVDIRGGGVALICASCLSPKKLNLGGYVSFESLTVQIQFPKAAILSVVYRRNGNATLNDFINDLTDYLCILSCLNKPLIILGDINIQLNKRSNIVTNFSEVLDIFNLKQFIHSPTHCLGNTLDPIISSNEVNSIEISDSAITDHFLLKFICLFNSLNLIKPSSMTVSYRKLDNIDIPSMGRDLTSCLPPLNNLSRCPDTILEDITSALKSAIDNHAPLITKTVKYRPQTRWYSDELRFKKRHRRACERKLHKAFRQNHPNIDLYRNDLKLASHSYFNALEEARQLHSKQLISNSSNKSKAVFNIVNKLLSTPLSLLDPPITSNALADFFISKIEKIRSSIQRSPYDDIPPPFTPLPLNALLPTSREEVMHIIKSSNKTFSPLDPVPAKLFLPISEIISPYLVSLFNSSFLSGVCPMAFKHAFLKPLLKKLSLDPEEESNYRPVSLLPFLSKILERIARFRILTHMSQFITTEVFQSGFKDHHSTETALLCVSNDLRRSADSGRVSLLVLLDMSAAFDTLDHGILINRLKNYIGLSDSALNWLISYLSNRSFQVKQGNSTSKTVPIKYGVPQGSVLGPLLFRIYILPLLVLLSDLGVSFHCYADDTQLYIPCSHPNFSDSIEYVRYIYKSISEWLSNNYLKLNDDKTDVILIGNPTAISHCKRSSSSIELGSHIINFSPTIKNLGVLFDESLSFTSHIKECRKSSFFLLWNLKRLRNYFDQSSFETIIHAFITSKLDYCNSLFMNLPSSTINRLQSIQNFAARLVLRKGKFCHITPLLKQLHWLPVRDRIVFKILLLTFKTIHSSEPAYLRFLLEFKTFTRSLRDQDQLLLEIPRSHSARMGDRAFSIAAPTLWNQLPLNIRAATSVHSFKSLLKTYLFSRRYSS